MYCVGDFPEPRQAIWEAPEALWQPHCVVVQFGSVGGWFPPGEIINAQLRGLIRMMGVYLGREPTRGDARFGSEDGCFSGRDRYYPSHNMLFPTYSIFGMSFVGTIYKSQHIVFFGMSFVGTIYKSGFI